MWSGHSFAHDMTAELSWHVQICGLITSISSRLEQKEFSWDLSYKLMFDCVIVPSSHAAAARHFHSPLAQPWQQPFACIRAVQENCHWGLKNIGNSHWSYESIMQWGTRQSQSIFRPTNHKRVMPANRRQCLLPQWQSYCHPGRTV